MFNSDKKIPLLVICGPTASGKTRLAVELAKRLNGEVVSADSMQIYKGMSIATAKPTIDEMQGVPHHLIDFLEPDKAFSVADYVKLAKEIVLAAYLLDRLEHDPLFGRGVFRILRVNKIVCFAVELNLLKSAEIAVYENVDFIRLPESFEMGVIFLHTARSSVIRKTLYRNICTVKAIKVIVC